MVINSDEVVISVDSPEEGQALLAALQVQPPFKASAFRLDGIELDVPEVLGHSKDNACVKRNLDGTWRLLNVSAPYYNSAIQALEAHTE